MPSPSRLRLLSPEESASIAGDTLTSQPCCPLCGQDLPTELPTIGRQEDDSVQYDRDSEHGEAQYFRVLERAHELSRPGTPVSSSHQRISRSESSTFRNPSRDEIDPSDLPAMGYYQRFFKENRRLGIGAEGSVYLATHIIGGSALGWFAGRGWSSSLQVPTRSRRLQSGHRRRTWSRCSEKSAFWRRFAIPTLSPTITHGWMRPNFHHLDPQSLPFTSS